MSVSCAEQRTRWDGRAVPLVTARVRFDGQIRTAQYMSIEYHSQPPWAGDKTAPVDYSVGAKRMMLFTDMLPNPSATSVRATCGKRIAALQKK